jgi:hypothetical protein
MDSIVFKFSEMSLDFFISSRISLFYLMPLTYLEPVSCYEVKVSETVGKLVFTFDE